MTQFSTNIVTHFPSKTLGTLFRNPNPEDPNIYVLFCGHCCSTNEVNATFLTFDNLTLNAKILNVNIWVDVAVAVIEDPTYVDFAVTTKFDPESNLYENEEVKFFSNYQINNSLARPITSNVRDPNYHYPQNIHQFFYPESFLLREAQGIKGISGSPVIDTKDRVVGLASKILSKEGDNLIVTKMSMIFFYLFSGTCLTDEEKTIYGIIPLFYNEFKKNPNINFDFNLLNAFRNSFNIVMCHLGFSNLSNRERANNQNLNLSKNTLGSILTLRITGLDKNSYQLVNFLQKNDPNIYYFRTLFEGTELMSDFYRNKSEVLIRTLEYTDRENRKKSIDFGIDSFAPYYVNGDPSQPITVTYRVYGPSGEDGVNLVYGPLKSITVQPILVDDSEPGRKRWSSQLPREFTSTSSRANLIMQSDLFNTNFGGDKYKITYAQETYHSEYICDSNGNCSIQQVYGFTQPPDY